MRHIPVLLNEVIEALQLRPGHNIIDCTVGDGGHAEAILEKTSPSGKLLALDADTGSLELAKANLKKFGERVTYCQDNFSALAKIISAAKFGPAHGVLMDLGWSSTQFAESGRGFSFNPPVGGDEPLDMRYGAEGKGGELTAAEILNTYSESELHRIFRQYGEEKLSREIAEAIIETRKNKPVERTSQLVEIILQVYRKKLGSSQAVPWVGGAHPATRGFQALRIEVNHELEALTQALPQVVAVLASQGRLAVISFHSLEDRIVKQYLAAAARRHEVRLINKKPIVATPAELKRNPRARSAKLRIIEKLVG